MALSNDHGETVVIFSDIGDDTELNEGICNGVLKTVGKIDEGIGISIERGVIDLGRQVVF